MHRVFAKPGPASSFPEQTITKDSASWRNPTQRLRGTIARHAVSVAGSARPSVIISDAQRSRDAQASSPGCQRGR